MTSKWLLVELYEDLDQLPGEPPRTTRTSAFRGIKQVPGVRAVTDLSVISADTLTDLLLPVDQGWRSISRKKTRA